MPQVEKGYIDKGDRVRVKKVEAFNGSEGDKKYLGMEGIVLENDGWGLCTVRFEDGSIANFWNTSDLEYITNPNDKK